MIPAAMMTENNSSLKQQKRLAEKSRDNWKAKAMERRKTIKRLKIEVRDKGWSRDYWKRRAKSAESALREAERRPSRTEQASSEGEPDTDARSSKGLPLARSVEGTVLSPPKGHVYPLFIIQLGIQGLIDSLMSVRGDAMHFQLWAQFFGVPTPSYSSVRMWVFRLGLYELQRQREYRTDWIWILDASVEHGQIKCLVVLGIAHARFIEIGQQSLEGDLPSRKGLALQHRDVEVLEMYVDSHFTGEAIDQRFEELSERVGCPIQIVNDHGGDIRKGVETFAQRHEQTIHTYDVTHQLAIDPEGRAGRG